MHLRLGTLASVVASLASSVALAQNLDVDGGTFVLNGPATYTNVTIEAGATLILNGTLNVTNAMTINTTGTLTEDGGTQPMVLNVGGTLHVAADGLINISGKGLTAGQTYNPITDQVVAGVGSYQGGAHGGVGVDGVAGGTPVAAYDNEDAPVNPGGGGGNGDCGVTGGIGGGLAQITAGILQLDANGSILANGNATPNCGNAAGGGAGGGLSISAATFTGAGTISANGGAAGNGGGGGGAGGRVLITSTTNTFTGLVSALGGGNGAPGSVAIKNSATPAALTLQDGEYHLPSSGDYASVTLLPGAILDLDGTGTISQTVQIAAGATVRLNSSSGLNNVTLGSTIAGTLIVDAPSTLPGSYIVSNGGLITHDALVPMTLTVSGTLEVQAGGRVDASGMGLTAGKTYDPATLNLVAGATSYEGGSYGGIGGGGRIFPAQIAAYGPEDQPALFGGGGGNGDCGVPGGPGGGNIHLTASTLQVDTSGIVQVNGANTPSCGSSAGGGAGGSLWLSVGTLTGGGLISASGGATGNGNGGSGGGGRIEIDYTTNSFTGTIQAVPGALNGQNMNQSYPTVGSVVLKDGSTPANYSIENGEYHLPSGRTVNSVNLLAGGILDLDGSATVTQVLQIPAGGTVRLNSTASLQNVTLGQNLGGTLIVDAASTIPSNYTVQNGGVITHDPMVPMNLTVNGLLDITAGGSLNASGKGLPSGVTIDPLLLTQTAGAGTYEGGSYGGLGGGGRLFPKQIAAYGAEDGPTLFGGGGGGGDCSVPGGPGGGSVRLNATTLEVDLGGRIAADGASTVNCGSAAGGGAGGSLWLTVGNLTGTGNISATGGQAGNGNSGGGGGGRIEIDYTTNNFTGTVLAAPGPGNGQGLNQSFPTFGSVVMKDAASPYNITIQDGEYHLSATRTVHSVTLLGGGVLDIDGSATITQPVQIPAGGTVRLTTPSSLQNVTLGNQLAGTLIVDAPTTLPGNFTIDNGGLITHDPMIPMNLTVNGTLDVGPGGALAVTGQGLPSGETYDPLLLTIVAGAGTYEGGSYGGQGGSGRLYPAPIPTYGNENQPQMFGGAGGGGDCSVPGGSGGGVVRLNATTLEVDTGGRVAADGAATVNCGSAGGGGAGGSLWLTVGTLTGSGLISASGGEAGNGNSGAGGGGRIEIDYTTDNFTGTVMAAAGPYNGEALNSPQATEGSVVFRDASMVTNLTIQDGEYHLKSGQTFATVTLLNGGVLDIDGNATVVSPISIPAGGTVRLTSASSLQNVTLVPQIYGTLIVDATTTLNGNFTIEPGGLVTHDPMTPMELTVNGTLEVTDTGRLDATGKGLPSGETYDPTLLTVTAAGAGMYEGGSYGGVGTSGRLGYAPIPIYGPEDSPVLFGGAGGLGDCSVPGGAGGGAVRLFATTLQVDTGGLVAANGANTLNCGSAAGGGAGGSLWLTVGTLTGTGLISASGGVPGNGNAGYGGGGRMEIDYGTNTFTGVIQSIGGGPGAGLGSMKLLSNAGTPDLSVEHGYYVVSDSQTFNSVSLLTQSVLFVDGGVTVIQPVSVPVGATVVLQRANSTNNMVLPAQIDGTLVFDGPPAWPGPHSTDGVVQFAAPVATGSFEVKPNGKLIADTQVQLTGNLTVDSMALLTHSQGVSTMDLEVTGTLDIQPEGVADVSGKGLFGGNLSAFGCNGAAIDPFTKVVKAGSPQYVGGSFGALGGGAGANAVYGSLTDVVYLGSGGGCGCCGIAGGNGGGLFRAIVGTLQVDGQLSSNGGATGNGGGGSGGAIYVIANTLTGSGVITANGGASSSGWGGGAGRILIDATTDTFGGQIQDNGGSGTSGAGSNGVDDVDAGAALAPTIISEPNLYANLNQPYAYQASGGNPAAIGTPPLTWTMPVGPTGATIDPATGAISWVPTALGMGSFTITVTNGVGSASQTFTVSILSAPKIVSVPNGSAAVGMPYQYDAADTVQVTGSAPISFTATAAPSGNPTFGVDQTGKVSWTPNAQGTYNACILAENAVGSDQQCFQVQVALSSGVPPQIVSTCNTVAVAGTPYQYDADDQAEATGTQPISWLLPAAPPGMTVASDGTIAWTPADAGTDTFTLLASNTAGSATQNCTVTVRPAGQGGAPSILRTANNFAAVGIPYRYSATGDIQAVGDTPMTFGKVSGPNPLNVDKTTGYVGWIPSDAGTVSITVSAKNASGMDSYPFTVNVQANAGPAPTAVIAGGPFEGPAPLQSSFDGSQSTSPSGILAWSWDFGDGSPVVQGKTAQHTYATCEGFIAKLTVIDVFGQKATASQAIQPTCGGNAPPSAHILLTTVVGAGSVQASFECDCKPGSAPIIGYQWLSSDGFSSDQPQDQHTFGPGSNTLQLTVVDQNGLSGVDRVLVSVPSASGQVPPFAQAFAMPPSGMAPATINYSATYGDDDGTISTVGWTFADGTTATDPSPTKTYSSPTQEHAVFSCTDSNGLTASSFVDVTISSASGDVPPRFISTPRTSIFAGEPYTYNKNNLPEVIGTGPFSFKLNAAPVGATADPGTGAITWTPPSSDTADAGFALEVDGKAGSAIQNWTVDVVPLAGSTSTPAKGCHCASLDPAGWMLLMALLPLGAARRRRPRPRP